MTLSDLGIPDEFPGTPAEKEANYHSHDWGTFAGETFCWVCECKPFHVAAEWPCGTEPTRHPARGGTS